MKKSYSKTELSHHKTTSNKTATLGLRPYQIQAYQGIFEAWHRVRRVLLQVPTGGGKTIIFAKVVIEFATRGERVVILVHREELLRQAIEKIQNSTGLAVGAIKLGIQSDPDALIQVASVQTLMNRLRALEDVGLIVVDEAHHATANSYRRILGAFPGAYILGVTATPIRTDGTGFEDLFDELVCGPTVAELIAQGFLSRFKLFADPNPMSTKGVKTQCGDYSQRDLAEENEPIELAGNLIGSYKLKCPGKRCIVFAINVAHSQAIADGYNAAGIPAMHLDGHTPAEERRAALQAFERGDIKVLSNCSLFGEGLDIPGIEAVQIARPTKSLALWLQMGGRCLRPAPGKSHAVILDHTKNWAIHGLPTRPRLWTLEGVEAEPRQAIPREDGEVEEVEPKEATQIIETSATLSEIELTPEQEWQQTLDDLLKTQQERNYKPGWTFHQLAKLKPPLTVWKRYERLRGYRRGWARHRFNEQQAQGGAA